MATITITLISGAAENELAEFALNFGATALEGGHKFNLFLFGNACNLANQEVPWTGERGMNQELTDFMDTQRLADKVKDLAAQGAVIHTCHTTEYGRGTEGCQYIEGVSRGNVGSSLTKFLLTSDAAFTLGG
ncbi:MAG: DsrE family protein [Desulfarculus sp.]|nr:DsrE family protein [Pseudomonadota bacterium]MBU4574400.1 DsrE family protein [Pseudomonadota bacterium]MBU4597513.1 DsrE family protein [Pseudomonadota bacterium]MBV1718006.1 DsrE family protein [Desulfarculus sp.]MBV1739245.1 DsrE family protein [Desulfarculus sp.]